MSREGEDPSRLGTQPNGKIFGVHADHQHDEPVLFPQIRIPPDFMPNGRKSLARISEHAFGLGIVLGISSFTALQLFFTQHYLWRLPAFVSVLSVFHYLEFEMTARYNPTDAKVASFLIFNNGKAYNIAHTAAMLEVIIRHYLNLSRYLPLNSFASVLPAIGLVLIILGQAFRSLAMKQAGTSFNHIVQSTKKEDHVLVTSGAYAVSRHPAYFGFFWWGLGTQLLLGNPVCFLGYTVILWKFFSHRIGHEEKHLLSFFGKDYDRYRQTTPVLIPLIS